MRAIARPNRTGKSFLIHPALITCVLPNWCLHYWDYCMNVRNFKLVSLYNYSVLWANFGIHRNTFTITQEASILRSHHEETRELPGERDNARNNEEDHARPQWTTWRRGQDSPWKSQSEWQRTGINRESTSMVWPTLGSRTAEEQNRTKQKRTYWYFKPPIPPST